MMTNEQMIIQNWRDLQTELHHKTVGVQTEPPINTETITTEDRLRGAIRAAMSQLQENRSEVAWTTLNVALKL